MVPLVLPYVSLKSHDEFLEWPECRDVDAPPFTIAVAAADVLAAFNSGTRTIDPGRALTEQDDIADETLDVLADDANVSVVAMATSVDCSNSLFVGIAETTTRTMESFY